jgi:hypothetical protein
MVGFAPLYHIGRKEGKKYEGRQPGGQAGGLLKLKKQEGGFFELIWLDSLEIRWFPVSKILIHLVILRMHRIMKINLFLPLPLLLFSHLCLLSKWNGGNHIHTLSLYSCAYRPIILPGYTHLGGILCIYWSENRDHKTPPECEHTASEKPVLIPPLDLHHAQVPIKRVLFKIPPVGRRASP